MAGHDPLYCEHGRTAATCEACAHADARADARRAPVTRAELYPFPNGGALTTGFLPEQPPAEPGGRSGPEPPPLVETLGPGASSSSRSCCGAPGPSLRQGQHVQQRLPGRH